MFKHKLTMAIKTITVTEQAYDVIKRLKNAEESFSELFMRIGSRQLTVKDIAGVLKQTPEESEKLRRRVHEVHERIGVGIQKRINDVRSRLKRFN